MGFPGRLCDSAGKFAFCVSSFPFSSAWIGCGGRAPAARPWVKDDVLSVGSKGKRRSPSLRVTQDCGLAVAALLHPPALVRGSLNHYCLEILLLLIKLHYSQHSRQLEKKNTRNTGK